MFDTLNLRLSPLPIETNAEDANDEANPFGVDMLSGFNVQDDRARDSGLDADAGREGPDQTDTPLLGGVAATYRPLSPAHGRGEGGQIQQVDVSPTRW